MSHPKRKLVFQPSIFSCYDSFREGSDILPIGWLYTTYHPAQGPEKSIDVKPWFLGKKIWYKKGTFSKKPEKKNNVFFPSEPDHKAGYFCKVC